MKHTFPLKAAALLLCTFILGGGGSMVHAQVPKDCLSDIQQSTGIPYASWYSITSLPAGSLPNSIAPTSSSIATYFSATTITNKVFFVSNDLVINSSITFDNCKFYLMPGVRVTVQSPYVFTAENHSLFAAACREMWFGITMVDYGSGSTVVLTDCTLSDMDSGVILKGPQHLLNAERDTFKSNWISIHVERTSSSYAGIIHNNEFYTDYALLPPHATLPSEMGIEVVDCEQLNIGHPTTTGYGNYFHDMKCGIKIQDQPYSQSHKVTVADATFVKITGASGYNLFANYWGTCIYGQANSPGLKVVVRSNNVVGDCSFSSSNKGIILDNIITDVSKVIMNSVPIGIATDKEDNSITVDQSTFNDVFWAIRVGMKPGPSSITDNTINSLSGLNMTFWPSGTYDFPKGIYFQTGSTSSGPTTVVSSITGNRIVMNADQGVAIEQRGPCNGLETSHNTIRLVPTNSYLTSTSASTSNLFAGIYCQSNQNGASIKSNLVYGTANTHYYFSTPLPTNLSTSGNSYEPSGITLFGARPYIECNRLINTRYGIQALINSGGGGLVNALRVKGNWFEDNCVGIMCMTSGGFSQGLGNNIGGPSNDNDNQFITNGTPGSTSWEVLSGSNVKVYFNQGTTAPSSRRMYTSSSTISISESIASTLGAEYVVTVPLMSPTTYACSTNYQVPLRTTTASSFGPEEVSYFETIARGQNADGASGNAVPWLQAKELYNFIADHQELIGVSSILDSFQSATTGGVFGQMRTAELAYAQLADSSVRSDSASYASAIAQAQSANNSIVPTTAFETNVKWMTRLRLSYIQHGVDSFSSADTAMISYLAHACPSDEGTAAEIGAYLYQAAIAPDNFEGQSPCGGSSNYLRAAMSQYTAYRLYPNPAKTQIFIEALSSAQLKGQGSITISNMIGQQVINQQLAQDGQPTSVDVSAVQSGVYYYQLHSAKGIVQSGKLIINH